MPNNITDRERFRLALRGENLGRPPLWVMRQAGRYLPEYRKLKEKYDFTTMVKTPELATEVTMQPLARFELDAAIFFSDILVIPEAMGQPYSFREKGGIQMEFPILCKSDFDRLEKVDVNSQLKYVKSGLEMLRTKLGDQKALLGFCGSPWTLACYMIDGGSSEGFPKTISLAKEKPVLFGELMEKITSVLVDYVRMQFLCGIDALQIFDSWHSLCPEKLAWEWSLKWIKEIISKNKGENSIILYAKAPQNRLELLRKTGADGLSLDQSHDLSRCRKMLHSPLCLQGNLPPEIMETNPENVRSKTLELLEKLKGDGGHILNLGHGIRPGAKIECMETLVETNRSFG